VVELPALHEGGALELRHEGETLRFAHGGMAGAFTSHWAAYYAASGHELTPVTNGRRLSLLYSLSRADQGPPLLPPSQAAVSRRLERLEQRWVADEEGDAPQKLVYFLENQQADLEWDGLEGDERSIVEALLGAKHGGEPAYDLFLATFTVREFKRAAGGWQEEESEAVDWEVHPDLDVPEVVVEAAEALGWPEDGEIVQGDDFFNLLHVAAHEGSEDSQDESDEEDYYHRRRYGYYDDYEERREKANKQRREKQRQALVLWPRRTRARVLSLEGVIGCAAARCCTPPHAPTRPRTPSHAFARPRVLSRTLHRARRPPPVAGSSRPPSMATPARSPAMPTSKRCTLRACRAPTAGRLRCSCACLQPRSCRRLASTRASTRSRS
jgi:hypothetical protein